MRDTLLSDGVWLALTWQSTAWLAAGLAASFLFRRRPARGHAALAVALAGLLATPLASLAVSRLGCGLLQPAPVQSFGTPLPAASPPGLLHDGLADPDLLVMDEQSSSLPARTSGEKISAPAARPRPAALPSWIDLSSALLTVWILMSAGLAARMALAACKARRLVAGMRPVTEAHLQRCLDEAAARIELGVVPALGAADVRSPIVWCWGGSPTVLVPLAAGANGRAIDWVGVFRHELAHWKRKDHLTGMLAQIATVLLPWHPLAWWAQRRLRELSEQACDHWAVADGRSPLDFAESLLKLHPEHRHRPALAAVTSRKLLAARVDRLLKFKPGSPRVGRRWTAVVTAVSLLMVAALALAQTAPARTAAESKDETKPEKSNPAEPADNQAELADAEMHVIGIYRAKKGIEGGSVEVEVRPTAKPLVLVLTSYFQVDWHIQPAEGARIKKAIVSGYFAQEIKGLPADVPVVNRSYFPDDGSRRKDGWFWASEWNTPQWREMVRRLNKMTGLSVATFQGKTEDVSFVIDGNRGRDFGQNGLKPRTASSKEQTPQELLAASANSELHIVGVDFAKRRVNPGEPMEVEVRSTAKPVVLVLTSGMETVWNIKLAEGAEIKAVIVGSPMPQEVDGISAEVPVHFFCPDTSFERRASQKEKKSFYAYKSNTFEYRRMVEKLNDLTGLLVSTFQVEYTGTPFVVDGTRGREFAQKERKPRPILPKEPTPQELLTASADADLHVVGIYDAKAGNDTPVDVEVQPTSKPIVLVLESYDSVLWNVKIGQGARVMAVIIGGYYEQEFEGIPPEIPILYRAYFPSLMPSSFYAHQWNTFEYRRMVEKLNDMTGLLVSTFQGAESAASFVVDGTRGRDFAQKERKPRPALPNEPTPQELLAASADADLHVVGVYQAKAGNGTPIDVDVRPTAKPIVLVLESYFSILWNVKIAQGAQVKAVIIGGFNEQEFEGIPANIPIVYRTRYQSRNQVYFYGYVWNTPECKSMLEKLNDLTGLPVSTFQGEYTGTSFVVDGKRGRDFAQKERKVDGTRGNDDAKKQPKKEEDPLADVADIPSQELQAADDTDKRYFLIGPRKDAKPPAEGHGLLVIMPGGDGSADFHPFVKRIYKNALSDGYLAAQPIALKWTPDQQIVWPTKTNPVAKMKFSTEEFVEAVIADVAKKHELDRTRVFTLSWSSSGPAAYATSLQNEASVTGSFIAMSVFNPKFLPSLNNAKGHAYYLYHSPDDRVCPYRMAEQAQNSLAENGAKVRLENYEGGHGWRGNVYRDIRDGIEWLEKNREKAGGP